jgi:predicted HTH domain antitoxin
MATINVPDDVLREAGLDAHEALVELACRLFDAGKLTLSSAARLSNLDRVHMEDALLERGLAVFRPSLDDLKADLRAIEHLESGSVDRR